MEAKINIYESITARVIAGLETDGLAWFRPWAANGYGPINHTTGRAYKGFNVFWLNTVCAEQGYEHNEWLTFNQAKAIGATLKKGERAKDKHQHVIFWMLSFKHEDKWYSAAQLKKMGIPQSGCPKAWNMRSFYVFNIAQFEDLTAKRPAVEGVTDFVPIEEAKKIYAQFDKRPSLSHGGDRAYYMPSAHHVQMPEPSKFVTADDYYKTLFHELTHSTGHADLLSRKGVAEVNTFGSDNYSEEELVAELGSEFLVGITGINPKDNESNSQAYINGWISRLKESDPKTIVYASQHAQKAVEFILKADAEATV